MKDLGEPYQHVNGSELSKVLGTNYYNRAIYTPGGFLMHPAALVRGLGDNLPDNVEVLENSPIRSLSKENGNWSLQAEHGVIKNTAVTAWYQHFHSRIWVFKNRLLPVMTFASWTRPLTDHEMSIYSGKINWGLTPADHAGNDFKND